MTTLAAPPLLAIFVGGKSVRMGEHKGLLPVPGGRESILEALIGRGRQAGFDPVLVGDAAPYQQLAPGVLRIDDDPPGAGPLGGLRAVLDHAASIGSRHLIAIACDMPYVTAEALQEVYRHRSAAIVVAPRRSPESPWEPMLARYDVDRLAGVVVQAISQGQRSFQSLFASIEVDVLPLTPPIERALVDWDSPEDMRR